MRSLLLLALLCPAIRADDTWPQFRGPRGSGVSPAKGLPTEWSETKNAKWKTAIHGAGWSSPVILGKNVWLTTATEDGKERYAVAIDRDTGKIVHDVKVFDVEKNPYTFVKGFNTHASPSAAVEEGRVYVHFGSAGTACLEAGTGKILWTRDDLKCDHFRGPGSSPILWEDLLILVFDGFDKQYVTALDKKDGKTAWETPRSIDYRTDNGDAKKAYCTPRVIDVDGKPQLVAPAAAGTMAYDPRTGKELWQVRHGGMNAATPPQWGHGLAYVTIGAGSTLVAVKPGKEKPEWTAKDAPSRPSPVLLGDLLFLVNDTGTARCLDAKTGKEEWKRRVGGNYYSSPVVADGHLFVFDRDGKGHVLTADREGKIVATNKLDGKVNATPAIAGKALYVRTDTHLY
ncbi:MAG: PQQ-binding-like beta-propeller repeat protein, partial [Gemmataceae bacterium]|nr:PQQ-binding-like beta-propeller repeat protein [Gemmataceae bacterium]